MTAVVIERRERDVPWLDGGSWYCPDPRGYCERCRGKNWLFSHTALSMIDGDKEYASWGSAQKISPWDAGELEYLSW